MGEEKRANYYDDVYATSDEYAKHFTESVYYPSWMAIAQSLRAQHVESILDVGCGPGQFGAFCRHYFPDTPYLGLDFSAHAIEQARVRAPGADFAVADLSQGLPFPPARGQTVVALEFLEHVPFDLELLRSLPPETNFIGSVPNFDWESHVRHFETATAVRERYAGLFAPFDVQEVLLNRLGTRLFLMIGKRSRSD